MPTNHTKNTKSAARFRAAAGLTVLLRAVSCGFVVSICFLLSALCIAAQNDLKSLERSVTSGDAEAKRSALFELRNLRTPEASRVAVPALADKDEIVRATAAGSVVYLPKDEAARALLPLLADKAEMVRREAAYALGEVGDPAATAPLVQLLQKDKIIEVKGAAAMALGKLGDISAIEALVKVLQTGASDDNEFLRRASARSIGQIAQFIQTGRIDNLTPQNFLPAKYKQVGKPKYDDITARYPAFKPAVSLLINTLQNPKEADDTRREAAFALGAIGDKSAFAALKANLTSSDPYLAEICKEAVAKFARTAN